MKTRITLAATAGLALMLGACGDANEVAETEMDTATMPDETANTTAMTDYDPMSRDYTLTAEQQERRDAFDMEAFRTDYDEYRTAMADDPNMASMTRADMQYSMLDQDGDNQLSAAEYALYAAPAGTAELTDDQVGQVADSYYYFDTDGDGFISDAEFSSLRAGGGMDAGASMDDSMMGADATATADPMDETM